MRKYLTGILFVSIGLLTAISMPTHANTPVQAAPVAQHYAMNVVFDPDTGILRGTLALNWTNLTGVPQGSIPFRLYPNGDHYGDGSIRVTETRVEGDAVNPVRAEDPTVMSVPLGQDVEPGQAVAVELEFETTIPVDLSGSFGILQHVSQPDWWALADWYPVVASWEPDEGWYLDPPTGLGDPTFASTTAMYDVTVRHPTGYVLIGAGEEVAGAPDGSGMVTTRFGSSRLREFAMVAMPKGDVVETTFDVSGQAVTITLPTSWAVPGLLDFIEQRVSVALPLYAEWFGVDTSDELDLTVAMLSGALGVSWDQMVWLDLEQVAVDGVLSEPEAATLELVIYHELGHQWLSGLIGANNNDHTFLTEGLVNTLVVAIVREHDGAAKARMVMGGFVAGPYRAFTNGGQDGIVDRPISDERSSVVHSFLVYGKAGVGFEAIRQEIGDDAFFDALHRLGTTFAERHFTPDDLLRLLEETSGSNLDELWSFWFLEDVAHVEDVDAVVAASGG